ncbi:hypothetical protein N7495_006592 [Penicillium taxi]|uniref:uncharacterized protein n=1 Tax=Penicillium taxi TaxID=168475 RepID=UPI0025453BB9|nr:uncharacterized protein N7495_006592 [Penicillium taxi]KAJ5894901.1 hypothetical protein N7495_006592 [Penicillium taxi]
MSCEGIQQEEGLKEDFEEKREPSQLSSWGLRPVWIREVGYPGLIPPDILELLEEDSHDHVQYIGPLSSLFWLGGLDELSKAALDSAYILEDETIRVPRAARVDWVLPFLFAEGKISADMFNRATGEALWNPSPFIRPVVLDSIPAMVTTTITCMSTNELYPCARMRDLPSHIEVAKLPKMKGSGKTVDTIRQYSQSLGGNLIFRVVTRPALASLMAFFIPTLSSNAYDNEFGPGIYASNSLDWVLKFGRRAGALMIFKNTDFRGLKTWESKGKEWQEVIATWTRLRLSAQPPSEEWLSSDVILGPISDPHSNSPMPVPSEYDQIVATSYASCGALSRSLAQILFFEE